MEKIGHRQLARALWLLFAIAAKAPAPSQPARCWHWPRDQALHRYRFLTVIIIITIIVAVAFQLFGLAARIQRAEMAAESGRFSVEAPAKICAPHIASHANWTAAKQPRAAPTTSTSTSCCLPTRGQSEVAFCAAHKPGLPLQLLPNYTTNFSPPSLRQRPFVSSVSSPLPVRGRALQASTFSNGHQLAPGRLLSLCSPFDGYRFGRASAKPVVCFPSRELVATS